MTGRTAPLRMRMFAGPNGSGKTTIQREIARHFSADFLRVLVNPDDLEAAVSRTGQLDLRQFQVVATDREVREALTTSAFLRQQQLADPATVVR